MSEPRQDAADAEVAIHEAASKTIQLIDEIDGAVRELKGIEDAASEQRINAAARRANQAQGR